LTELVQTTPEPLDWGDGGKWPHHWLKGPYTVL